MRLDADLRRVPIGWCARASSWSPPPATPGFDGTDYAVGYGYNTVSITDPGNAESVITVGSTHRSHPHRHGVSYFSSRGPTADGRSKPDLLAPGEDIDGPVPGGGLQAMHGTSQAAAHVSGAAAILMARYRELRGQPERVKDDPVLHGDRSRS